MLRIYHRMEGLSQELLRYEELEIRIKQLTGFNLECLEKLFAMGFTLKPPEYDLTLSIDQIANLVDMNQGGL